MNILLKWIKSLVLDIAHKSDPYWTHFMVYFHCVVACFDASLSIILCYHMFKGSNLCGTEPSVPPRLDFKVRIWVRLRLGKRTGEFCQWELSKRERSRGRQCSMKMFVRICLDTDSVSEPFPTFGCPEAIWCDTRREAVNSRGSRQRHTCKHPGSDIRRRAMPDWWVRQRTETPKQQLFHHMHNTHPHMCVSVRVCVLHH